MKTICSQKHCGSVLPLVLLILPLAMGCGQPRGTVSGKVTYRGKPLSSGTVMFVLEKGGPLHSDIQGDGSYRVDNVPVGPVKIGVRPKVAQDTPSAMPQSPKDYQKLNEAMTKKTKSGTQIPPKYADPEKSGLTYTVEKGQQQYDIALK